MKEAYSVIRSYLFNGAYAYVIFGIYALTISPTLTHFLDFGEKNYFIAFFGFLMMIAEFFALAFKLKMVRIRSGEKRRAYKKETGLDVVPSVSPIVYFGFFMRLAFRITIVMVCMTAFGYTCNDKEMSPQGVWAIMLTFLADMGGFIYIYFKTDFYSDPPRNKYELKEEIQEDEDWDKENAEWATSDKAVRYEILSDFILQVYALMLFTSFWRYINDRAIEMLGISYEGAGMMFVMLFVIVMIALMPMRIAYWIEDSLNSYSLKEKIHMWTTFFIVAIFCCSPAIMKYISIAILKNPFHSETIFPEYVGYLISIGLFLILLLLQIFVFRKKKNSE